MTETTCIGFGEFDGTCEEPAGSHLSKLWCQRCDDLRIAHISGQMAEITESFTRDVDPDSGSESNHPDQVRET